MGRVLGWVLVLAAGCGRLGFDGRASDGGPGDTGASDTIVSGDACTFGAFGAVTAIAGVNTSSEDWGVWISDDRLELIFASDRAGTFDLYRAIRASELAPFSAPQPIPVAADVGATEDDAYVTPDGLTLWFDSNTAGSYRIYTSTRASRTAAFQAPVEVNTLTGGTVTEGPNLSTDGLTVEFDSDRSGAKHLYRASRAAPTSPFGAITEIAELIGPAGDETTPTLAGDATIYYATTATGPSQIATATLSGAVYGPFTTFAPISNGSYDDVDPYITADGRTMVFSSTRAGSGSHDLFILTRACQ